MTDPVVIDVSGSRIRERRAVASDYSLTPPLVDPRVPDGTSLPKYDDPRPTSPYAMLGLGPLEQRCPFLLDQVIAPCLYDPAG